MFLLRMRPARFLKNNTRPAAAKRLKTPDLPCARRRVYITLETTICIHTHLHTLYRNTRRRALKSYIWQQIIITVKLTPFHTRS